MAIPRTYNCLYAGGPARGSDLSRRFMLPEREAAVRLRRVVVYPDDPTEIEVAFQGFRESTINRMELAACIAAMNWVKEEGIGRRYGRVQIFSDSQYVVTVSFPRRTGRRRSGATARAGRLRTGRCGKNFCHRRRTPAFALISAR